MDEAKQEKAIESLQAWSKWLIGLNFGGVAGCAFIFEQSRASFAVTPFLLSAIVFFGLSLGASAVLLRELARVSELLPLHDASGNPSTVFDQNSELGLSIRALTMLQLGLLGAAAFFFMVWTITKAIAG